MKVLIVTQYFWPEFFIINDLVETLVSQGHTIKVLTGKPNYPDGQLFDGYSQHGTKQELFAKKASVFRAPLCPRRTGDAKDLLLNYGSFIWNGFRFFPPAVKNEHYDAILVFSPSPITAAIPAIYLRWKLKTHLVIWVQDLWPESLSATGFIKNKIALKLISYLVKGIYACSDTLLVQSQAFIKPIEVLAKQDKIQYFPNAIHDMKNAILDIDGDNVLSEELKKLLEVNFCIVFAGNIGKAQSIETLISVAVKLRSRPSIKIVFVGKGSMLEWAQQEVARLHLKNVVFTGAFPINVMPSIFSSAQALLVSLKSDKVFSYTIPSKVQAYMSAGRPIIASIDGEAARIINEANAGLTCAAGDVNGLVERIVQMFKMSQEDRGILGENGRRYFLEHFEIERQCKKLVEIIEKRIGKKR
ncbi:MAG: glycosyltransferase WbuB [Methylophaga sp.]|nr:MAG: glycosyltransferase WbuB [Methylophaga sp.]